MATETDKARHRSGRPAQIGLTRQRILDAALAVIDEKGLAGFSMRELSASLGVYPASIYWHVGGSKAQLFAEIAATITANAMRPEDVHDDWRETLRRFFRSYRAAVAQHPNVAQLLGAQMQSNGLPNAPMVEIVLGALQRAGYNGQALADAFNAVIGGLAGFVTMEFGPAPPDRPGHWAETMNAQIDALDAQAFPVTAAHAQLLKNRSFVLRWENGSSVPLDTGFDCLVEALIAGLDQRSPAAPKDSQPPD